MTTTDFQSLADDIRNARDLDALCAAVNRFYAEVQNLDEPEYGSTLNAYGLSMAGLPTFGGEEPRNTMDVWSWDERRVMVGDAAPFVIEERNPEAWLGTPDLSWPRRSTT